MIAEQTQPDWVLLEAAKRSGWGHWKLSLVRIQLPNDETFGALCDMIQKYEQQPVDRKLVCAREASAQLDDNGELHFWRSGEGDHALDCCLRSLTLYEEGFK